MNLDTIPADWRAALDGAINAPSFAALQKFVDAERATHPGAIFPAAENVFLALTLTPLHSVRVLILGQDPYPTRGHAHGLAFSVNPEVRPLPASLRNIYKEFESDLGIPAPATGSLIPWAKQGVLLLNTVLTVQEGEANSHKNQGWELFTDEVIRTVSQKTTGVIFVLWGKPAQKKETLIDAAKHIVLRSPHPSPLSASTGFFGSRPFSAVNRALQLSGRSVIDWRA